MPSKVSAFFFSRLSRAVVLYGLVVLPLSACATTTNMSDRVADARPAVVVVEVFSDRLGRQPAGQGSGFFVSESGDVITNRHVVEGGRSARVQTADASTYRVVGIIGESPVGADAVRLAVDVGSNDVRYLSIAKELPAVNDEVRVLGAPLGLEQTVTGGIVSAIREDHPTFGHVIQIDAAITHGSSGGPVIDRGGRVVGISVGGEPGQEGMVQGLNFAVPAPLLTSLTTRSPISLDSWTEARFRARAADAERAYTAGKRLFDLKLYALANMQFLRAIRLNRNLVKAWTLLGLSSIRSKNYQDAIAVYEHLVTVKPDVSPYRNNYGFALSEVGRLHDAVEQFLHAIRLDARNGYAYGNLGLAYLRLRRFPDAINAFQDAIRIEPGKTLHRFNLALAFARNRNMTAAWREYWRVHSADEPLATQLLTALRRLA